MPYLPNHTNYQDPAWTQKVLTWAWWLAIPAVLIITNPAPLYFLNDDFIYVSSSPGFKYLYRTAFRPVSDLTLYLDYLLYGQQGWGYHLTNVFFHVLNTFLIHRVVLRMQIFQPNHSLHNTASLAALLFWCYPFHSESIFWIIGRGGSLVTILFLAALCTILSARTQWYHWAVAVIAFSFGLFTYESAWLMPAAFSIILFFKYRSGAIVNKADKLGHWMSWAILVVSFFVRKYAIGDFIGSPYLNTEHFSLTIPKLAYNYATGLLRSIAPPMAHSAIFLGFAGIALMLLFFTGIRVFRKGRWHPGLSASLLLFLLTLGPIVILGVNTHTSESERFLYLPSAFLCVWVASLTLALKPGKKVFLASMSCVILYFSFFLYHASLAYKLASQWNKETMVRLKENSGRYGSIHVFNLPTQYKGGFMFRLGFEEGLRWICPDLKYDTLVIHSALEITNRSSLKTAMPSPEALSHYAGGIDEVFRKDKWLLIAWHQDSLLILPVGAQLPQ